MFWNSPWRFRRASRTALKNCQAIASDMTLVLPLPVAILTQYRANRRGRKLYVLAVLGHTSPVRPLRLRTFSNFPNEYESLNRFLLRRMILERNASASLWSV